MQSPTRPPKRMILTFARPLSQEDYERQEGIIETPDGPLHFMVGDFPMRHRRREHVVSREHMEQEYSFVLGSRTGWACYRLPG
jgi:hypothetical protein